MTRNQCVTTVQDPTTSPIAPQYQKDKDRYKTLHNKLTRVFKDKLKQGAKKNSLNINEANFKNEEDTNLGNYSEEHWFRMTKYKGNKY